MVGDTPSNYNTDKDVAFIGAKCYETLREWVHYLDVQPYLINRTSDNFEVSVAYAVENNYPIIALGNNAEKALKDLKAAHFKLPHPSGRNRQLNDKKFIETKLLECSVWLMS